MIGMNFILKIYKGKERKRQWKSTLVKQGKEASLRNNATGHGGQTIIRDECV